MERGPRQRERKRCILRMSRRMRAKTPWKTVKRQRTTLADKADGAGGINAIRRMDNRAGKSSAHGKVQRLGVRTVHQSNRTMTNHAKDQILTI